MKKLPLERHFDGISFETVIVIHVARKFETKPSLNNYENYWQR